MKLLLAAAVAFASPALAVECPRDMPACKVLFLSPQEEQLLTAPQGVLLTASEGRKVDYAGFVQYFLQRIKEAPNGTPHKDPEPAPAQTPTPSPEKKEP
jgi:hypothetical protein